MSKSNVFKEYTCVVCSAEASEVHTWVIIPDFVAGNADVIVGAQSQLLKPDEMVYSTSEDEFDEIVGLFFCLPCLPVFIEGQLLSAKYELDSEDTLED